MRLVSLKCMECSEEMAKVNVPVGVSRNHDNTFGVLCIPCAEKVQRERKLFKNSS